ncbi:MAG: hypothetical protein SVU69_04220 [Pseudomonadota bacterium]|nr:hypothetical protein [Pseudomonadota bacterium]
MTLCDAELKVRMAEVDHLTRAICERLEHEVHKLGFSESERFIASYTEAHCRLARDPATGRDGLVGVWQDPQGCKCGEFIVHADGSFFAEYDVVRVHPRDPRWFVEAVTAWGREALIKSEPRLLPISG